MGEGEDFISYMRARWAPLVRSLVVLGCPTHKAEDVAQAALVRCYAAWGRVRRADDIDAYVYRVLLNTWASSRLRRWWGERPTDMTVDHAQEDSTSTLDLRMILTRALAGLSPEHREVLVLRYVADLTEVQVASVLGIPVGTVKSRVARAIARIDIEQLREATT